MSYTPTHTTFEHPAHLSHLPTPSFEFLLHLQCECPVSAVLIRAGDMESFTEIGEGPYGRRMNVIFSK